MSEHSALTNLIRRGRRRQLRNLLIHESSFSATLALGGAVLLLLLGTQILNWYWPVILFALSLGVGIYRARHKVRSPYEVAQSMDRHLGFHDSLSTAFFFNEHPANAHAAPDFVQHQRDTANDLARSADISRGVPFVAPRTFYVNAALALVAFGMFGLRYGINRSLDLRASLVHIDFDGYFSPKQIADAKKFPGKRPFDQDGNRDKGMAVDPWVSEPADLDAAPDSAGTTVDTPEVNNPDGTPQSSAKTKATGKEPEPPAGDPLDTGDEGKSSQPGSESKADANSAPDGSQQGKQSQQKAANQSPSSGENSSLTDKMRDALANLLAKMKMQPKNGEGKQGGSSAQNNSQQANKQGQSQDPNASQSQSQQQSDASASAQSQSQQQSSNGQQQAAQGKGDSRSADKPNSPDGKSGIGRQDGDKTAREAEQLAAMGKISEIIGKRSANVTGEVMVEVSSGKQQLKTQYSQRKAGHAEAGGEINRDEVPLAYQQYVQQYFEEIRKLPAAKSKPDAKPKSSGN